MAILHHPPARQHRKGWHGRRFHTNGVPAAVPRPLHDRKEPAALLCHLGAEWLATVGHVGPDVLPPIEGRVGGGEQPAGHVGISQIGGMDKDTPQETRRLTEEMAFATIEILRAVRAVAPPLSVVFAICTSMMAPEGCTGGPRPVRTQSQS